MTATIIINRLTSTGPTATPITSATTRLKQADNGTQDTNNPVPAVGTLDSNASVSCWCVTRLECTVAPVTAVNNLFWYADNAAMATGTKLKGESATAYVQAPITGLTFGGAGELTVANYTGLTTPVIVGNAAAGGVYTSAAKKTMSGSTTTTEQFGDRFVYQLQVASAASPGVITAVLFTWQYDET